MDLVSATDLDFNLTFSGSRLELRNLFPTAVVVAPINEADRLNPILIATIAEHARDNPGVVKSNAGGWQSSDDFHVWGGPPAAQLLTTARALADGLTGIQGSNGFTAGAPDWKMNAWASINRAGDRNHAHHHPAAFWSGVYWVDAGETGEINAGGEFEMADPRGVLPAFYAPRLRVAAPGHLSAGACEFITPATGTLILFPAWLIHSVRPYTGDRPRVSVAFNLSV